MRILKTLLASSLFFATALGADFAGTYADYRNMVKLNLGIAISNNTAYSDTTLNQFLRQSVIEINPVIRGSKLTTYTTTLFQKTTYTLDTAFLYIESVEWIKRDSIKGMKYVSRETFWQQRIDATIDQKGYMLRPSFYDFFDRTIYVYPAPTIVGDTIRITGYRKIPSISALDSLSLIPQAYRGAIVHYATWLAARSRQHPLTEVYKKDAFEEIMILSKTLNQRKNPSDSGK